MGDPWALVWPDAPEPPEAPPLGQGIPNYRHGEGNPAPEDERAPPPPGAGDAPAPVAPKVEAPPPAAEPEPPAPEPPKPPEPKAPEPPPPPKEAPKPPEPKKEEPKPPPPPEPKKPPEAPKPPPAPEPKKEEPKKEEPKKEEPKEEPKKEEPKKEEAKKEEPKKEEPKKEEPKEEPKKEEPKKEESKEEPKKEEPKKEEPPPPQPPPPQRRRSSVAAAPPPPPQPAPQPPAPQPVAQPAPQPVAAAAPQQMPMMNPMMMQQMMAAMAPPPPRDDGLRDQQLERAERRAEEAERRAQEQARLMREQMDALQREMREQMQRDRDVRAHQEGETRTAEMRQLTEMCNRQQQTIEELRRAQSATEDRWARRLNDGLEEARRDGRTAAERSAQELARDEVRREQTKRDEEERRKEQQMQQRLQQEERDYEQRARMLLQHVRARWQADLSALERRESGDRDWEESQEHDFRRGMMGDERARRREAADGARRRDEARRAAAAQRGTQQLGITCPTVLSVAEQDSPVPYTTKKFGEVYAWLSTIGMAEQYAAVFAMNEFDLTAAAGLTEKDLDAMGIAARGARIKLLGEARQLAAAGPLAVGGRASPPPPPHRPRPASPLGLPPPPAPPRGAGLAEERAVEAEIGELRAAESMRRELLSKEVAAEWGAQRRRDLQHAASKEDYDRIAEWDLVWRQAAEDDAENDHQADRLLLRGWTPPSSAGAGGVPGGARARLLLDRIAGRAPPPVAGGADGGGEWEEYQTHDGTPYFYSPVTGETSWDPPNPY